MNSGLLTFQLTVADQAHVAELSVAVVNPAPGGGTSTVENITLYSGTPTPSIHLVSPNPLYVGEGNTNLLIQGTNFTSTSVVEWNGTALQTTVSGSSTTIGATVPDGFLAVAGTASVNVYNPTSNPGLSNTITVPINIPPVPQLTSLSPNVGPINDSTSLRILGGPFLPSSTVSLNGTTILSTYAGQAEIDVTIPASSIAVPGNYNFW